MPEDTRTTDRILIVEDEENARLGYEGWFRPGAERELMTALRTRMGAERVLFSREGFNAV